MKAVTIKIPYPDEDNDGKVDGTKIKETTLKMYWYDETAGEWKSTLSCEINITENYVTAQVAHLTDFDLFGDDVNNNNPGSGGGGCFISTAAGK